MRTAIGVLLLWMGEAAAFGQGIGQAPGLAAASGWSALPGLGAPLPREPGVLRVYSVGAEATYYSAGLPYGYSAPPTGAPEQPAAGAGGSISLGWSDIRENSTATVLYAGSYAAETGYTGSRFLSQSLFFNWQRKLKAQWDLKVAGSVAIATRDQYLYTPTSAGSVASPRISFADLAATALGGGTSGGGDSGLGAGFGGSGTTVSEPLGEALFGTRVLTTQLTTRLTYHELERLSWMFTLFGVRMESLPDANNAASSTANTAGEGPLAPISTAVSGDVRLQYLWSPRTTLRVDLSETRTVSRIEDIFTTRAVAGITHTLSERWLVEGYAGGSQLSPLHDIYSLPTNPGYVAGGSLAFQTFSNMLMGSVAREVGDSYGLGAISTLTGRAMWTWRRPGAGWLAQAIFAVQKLNEGASVQDWSATGAITRIVNQHLTAQVAYVYFELSESPMKGILPDQSSLRVSATWYPQVLLYP
jgi:hypothetical protein